MKYVKEEQRIDGIAAEDDMIDVRIHNDLAGGHKLYVDVNGVTILRIGRIRQKIELIRDRA